MAIVPLPPPTLGVIAVAAAVGWLALVFVFARATRTPHVPAGPATDDLGPESPAVVDLITGSWRLCDEAASATLLDLAARRVVILEEIGPELSLVRLRRRVDTAALRPYERMIYDHVARLANDGVVATGALAEGARHLRGWWRRFRAEVVGEARRLGLSQPRWRRAHRVVLTAATALPGAAVALWVLSVSPGDGDDLAGDLYGAGGAGFVTAAVLTMVLERLNGERGTAAGAAAAGRWLGVAEHLAATGGFAQRPAAAVTIWGRSLAYAAALGLAPRAVASLPVGRPADDSRAWSDYGGMWHPVEVRYRGRGLLRPLWGHHWSYGFAAAVGTAAVGFALAASGLIAVSILSGGSAPPTSVVPLALVVAAAAGAVPLCVSLVDGIRRTLVHGQVVRRRVFGSRSRGSNGRPRYWVALDDGRHRRVHAYGTDAETWAAVREGDVVRATVGRRTGWLYRAEVLTWARHRAAAAEAEQDALAAGDMPESLAAVGRGARPTALAGLLAPAGPAVDPAALLTPDDLGRALGGAFARPEPTAYGRDVPTWFGLSSCRFRGLSGPVTVEVHAAPGRRSGLLMPMAMQVAGGPGRAAPEVGPDAMVWPDMVAVTSPGGGCMVRVSSPNGPPGPQRMAGLGAAAAARLGVGAPGG